MALRSEKAGSPSRRKGLARRDCVALDFVKEHRWPVVVVGLVTGSAETRPGEIIVEWLNIGRPVPIRVMPRINGGLPRPFSKRRKRLAVVLFADHTEASVLTLLTPVQCLGELIHAYSTLIGMA